MLIRIGIFNRFFFHSCGIWLDRDKWSHFITQYYQFDVGLGQGIGALIPQG